ncbi:MAG TPA: acyl--CoA ligase [Candidatus Binataceae bacterium]|nr:acyl--CoA ligase [Candidatus Binataceae bacterium]
MLPGTNTLTDLITNAEPSRQCIIGVQPEVVISYGKLAEQVERLSEQLVNSGLKSGDRVGIVLPNGPEFMIAFLAVTQARLTAAPYNEVHKAGEFTSLFEDGEIRALISRGANAGLKEAAEKLSLPVWPLSTDSSGSVQISIPQQTRSSTEAPHPDDIALFLHTSGTTSKPKGVPLTHSNIMHSLRNIAECYKLTPDDRTLLVMPLFHVHGLIGATLSTIYSGGTVIAPERFSASGFWPLAMTHRATWYSAVPTIHRTLLLRADTDAPPRSGFRFIRSCSSALAPAILNELEDRFHADVLEAYGMTEACHQIASNPLPPLEHKPASVGKGGRVEIAVIDEQRNMVAAGASGEVVIKGPNVMGGYYKNPEANAAAFVNGYLRTGDRGTIDKDGYVFLLGRIKELINRGGEKISPVEVDAALLSHPAVAEAASFGAPDQKYGEEVCAAVILKAETTAAELQAHCKDQLADFKVPKTIHIVTQLPKTATGKIQRNSLAEFFGNSKKPS